MHQRKGTERNPKPGPCAWETLRNQNLNVSNVYPVYCDQYIQTALEQDCFLGNNHSWVKLLQPATTIALTWTPSRFSPESPLIRKRPANEKATDDYHYEKFKKMNRRYWNAVMRTLPGTLHLSFYFVKLWSQYAYNRSVVTGYLSLVLWLF